MSDHVRSSDVRRVIAQELVERIGSCTACGMLARVRLVHVQQHSPWPSLAEARGAVDGADRARARGRGSQK